MKPPKPMPTSGQKPMTKDSFAAFVLLVILLFSILPAWKAALAIGLIFGAALPLVLCERQMIFAYNAGRPYRRWWWLGLAIAAAMLIGVGAFQMHRFGLWP